MRTNFIALITFVLLLSCKRNKIHKPIETAKGNISVLIKPNQTDAAYSSKDECHYVVRNPNTQINKLFLFIGGSFSTPENYKLIIDHAASVGLDAISLAYPNSVAAAPLGTSTDPLVFDNYRDELCFGNQVSNEVSVDVLNSISTRTIKLIQYLQSTYPDQNWGQYLTTTNTLHWDKVVVSGHSQGSGHACYLAKKNLVDRVAMLSGPNDYSTNFGASANWLTLPGLTPLSKHYSLLHTKDEIVPFTQQVANTRALGLLGITESPVLVDNLTAPYQNAHSLSLGISALSFHSSTVSTNSKLPAIWTYMFVGN
jgi:hypothetical protein